MEIAAYSRSKSSSFQDCSLSRWPHKMFFAMSACPIGHPGTKIGYRQLKIGYKIGYHCKGRHLAGAEVMS